MQSYHEDSRVANSKGGCLVQTNRSFLYGESVFTTARVRNDKILFLEDHIKRLLEGANFFWGPLKSLDLDLLSQKIHSQLSGQQWQEGVRITLSYDDQLRQILRSKFDPDKIMIDFLHFPCGLKQRSKLKSFTVEDEQHLLPSFLKSSRRTFQTILMNRTQKLAEDESLLFCGPDQDVFESSWANIFAIKDNVFYTPPVGGSVLDGIMRKKILQEADVRIENFKLGWLKTCDFVFLSNALWGIIPVEKIDGTHFNQPTTSFTDLEKAIYDKEV